MYIYYIYNYVHYVHFIYSFFTTFYDLLVCVCEIVEKYWDVYKRQVINMSNVAEYELILQTAYKSIFNKAFVTCNLFLLSVFWYITRLFQVRVLLIIRLNAKCRLRDKLLKQLFRRSSQWSHYMAVRFYGPYIKNSTDFIDQMTYFVSEGFRQVDYTPRFGFLCVIFWKFKIIFLSFILRNYSLYVCFCLQH